jgi:hypothetical protein
VSQFKIGIDVVKINLENTSTTVRFKKNNIKIINPQNKRIRCFELSKNGHFSEMF